ncbi:hypothetical protein WICMUC_002093 [Wickerhamomyces mucosus]|uniref:MICOS complex subunit n=1 Tax=Wickerhamomyces mucosus TaxID=1378264 RepID=A0A9P8PQM8_9ASCO|nr:hypothetical protein WICMUC_002093 [Wickerhamomyces mucosus]
MAGRKFYEDEEAVTPLPGTVIAASEADIEALGPNKLINGSSIRSPILIESKITSGRQAVDSLINHSTNKVNSWATAFHKKEETFTNTLLSLHNTEEDLLPASLYILIGALTGTIITRRSNIVFKTIAPVTLGLFAFKFTLPKTFSNTTFFAHDLESQNLPKLTKKQDDFIKHVDVLANKTENSVVNVQKSVNSWTQGFKTIFKKYTGLKIDDDVTKD